MKIHVLLIAGMIGIASCQSQDVKKSKIFPPVSDKDTTNYTSIKWLDSVKNIGTITEGKKAEIKFRFQNTGKKPLFIISAEPGCGCTIADYPKKAIAPGELGLITANYDVHKGSAGEFRKNIHVTTNTKGTTSHYIFFYGIIKSESDTTTNKKTTYSD